MLALLAFSLFCILTVFGTPDSSLVAPDAKIALPYGNANIAFEGFLIAAPFLLIVLTLYLHVFEDSRRELEAGYQIKPLPTLFTLDRPLPNVLSSFIFFWMVPATLAAITWKALARLEWGLPLLCVTYLVFWCLIWRQIARLQTLTERLRNVARIFVVVAFASNLVLIAADRENLRRPLDLFRADLSNRWLTQADLRYADLRHANLKGANLFGARLQGADLSDANLQGANLKQAVLEGVQLYNADLQEANLSGANLLVH